MGNGPLDKRPTAGFKYARKRNRYFWVNRKLRTAVLVRSRLVQMYHGDWQCTWTKRELCSEDYRRWYQHCRENRRVDTRWQHPFRPGGLLDDTTHLVLDKT